MTMNQETGPVTLEELRCKFKKVIGFVQPGITLNYTIIPLHDHFKIVGYMAKGQDISTFTVDLTPNISRRFIDTDLASLIVLIKESFDKFVNTSHRYSFPFENYTFQNVFYCLMQIHFRILDTVPNLIQSQHLDQQFNFNPQYPLIMTSQPTSYLPPPPPPPSMLPTMLATLTPQTMSSTLPPLLPKPQTSNNDEVKETQAPYVHKRKRYKPVQVHPKKSKTLTE